MYAIARGKKLIVAPGGGGGGEGGIASVCIVVGCISEHP